MWRQQLISLALCGPLRLWPKRDAFEALIRSFVDFFIRCASPISGLRIAEPIVSVLFRIPVRECARTLWMGAPSWREGDRVPQAGTRSVSWAQIREEERRDEMRKRQEVKEDYPFMASRCEHAQSKLMCIAKKKRVNMSVTLYSLYLLYLLFQENKSFGANTICIHPLM